MWTQRRRSFAALKPAKQRRGSKPRQRSPGLWRSMMPPTHEPWLRMLGIVTLALSFYYILAAYEEVLSFFRWTILGRSTVFVGVSVLVVGGLVPAVVVVFAVIDALGAMWTAAALRSDRVAAAN